MLDQERAYFGQHQQEWERAYPGKFVLIKGSELVRVFDTLEDALVEGAKRYGLAPFLARSVSDEGREITIPAMALGVLHANPSCAV